MNFGVNLFFVGLQTSTSKFIFINVDKNFFFCKPGKYLQKVDFKLLPKNSKFQGQMRRSTGVGDSSSSEFARGRQ